MPEQIEGLSRLLQALSKKKAALEADARKSVRVGYTVDYALWVHEDLTKSHGQDFNILHAAEIAAGTEHPRRPQERAKFLEEPLRQNKREYQRIIEGSTGSLSQRLYLAGLQLQRDSMEIVPVDTGALRQSAFTRLEGV
jgi:hypothetical protein